MTREAIIERFKSLNVWKRGNIVAPHKPLLVLYALDKLRRGENQLIPYTEIEEKLTELLNIFGTGQSKPRPHYPFWRLREDNVWKVTDACLITETSSGDAHIRALKRHCVSGGFQEEIAHHLQNDFSLALEISESMLDHFRSSKHKSISQAVGIEYPSHAPKRQRRDQNFPKSVLKAYDSKCTVCGLDIKFDDKPIVVEASHIRPLSEDGPDIPENGLALCLLHHRLFDRGAFTLSERLEVLVSNCVNRSKDSGKWLIRYHKKKINYPQSQMYYPRINFIDWHSRKVFKGPYLENS